MVQRGLSSFRPTEVILTHKRKVQKHEVKLINFVFREGNIPYLLWGQITVFGLLRRGKSENSIACIS